MNVRPVDLAPLIAAAILGCRSPDQELVREAITRQSEQNQATTELQREVAAGARELVASDADARLRSVELQRQLQGERTRLSASWDDLERQRQRAAQTLRTESFLTALVQGGSGVVAALFALAALRSVLAADVGDEAELAALLLEEIPLQPLGPAPSRPSDLDSGPRPQCLPAPREERL